MLIYSLPVDAYILLLKCTQSTDMSVPCLLVCFEMLSFYNHYFFPQNVM